MKKLLLSLLILLSFYGRIFSQNIDSLNHKEIILQSIADSMLDGSNQMVRLMALKKFIPTLSKTLKIKGSMQYPFDSLRFMKMFTAPDNSFRLYNWLIKFDDGTFHYFAALQYFKNDSVKVLPFRDKTKLLDTTLEEVVLNTDEWVGALYYEMVPCKIKRQKYYILLGWDGFNRVSDRKIMEVFYFDRKTKQPKLGAPIFKWGDRVMTRVIFFFNGNATLLLNYVPSQKVFTVDHLVPPNPLAEGRSWLYVPDGTYDFFKFKRGKWTFKEGFFENSKAPLKEAGDTPDVDRHGEKK
ncbi:MAG: hypothetical protein NTX03_04665 [Bacteroidetes bacterium]|nr:hypothetical protein [Bacteroidota bacterium]